MMAVYFVVGGLFRIIFALVERFDSWGWMFFNGIVTLLLGILIWKQWPFSDGLTVAGEYGKRVYVNKKGKVVAPFEREPTSVK